jgi:hypothetical protein
MATSQPPALDCRLVGGFLGRLEPDGDFVVVSQGDLQDRDDLGVALEDHLVLRLLGRSDGELDVGHEALEAQVLDRRQRVWQISLAPSRGISQYR